MPKTKEPITDFELEAALDEIGCELLEHDTNRFSVRRTKTGASTRLEAEDFSSALFEAWSLMRLALKHKRKRTSNSKH